MIDQAEGPLSPLEELAMQRLVRYEDLKPCTTAFIDTRTPGRQQKENFTIIGPGVAENPDQHVHIEHAHGFNIGGARQPPGCINSQHTHETAEVFVVHKGNWAFYLGPECDDGEVVLGPGDTISIPVQVFRGFKNVGEDLGFMFAVLGGDDPGHVTWAPEVFEKASRHGLILLEDGSLVDTTKNESIPAGKKAMKPTTHEDVARVRRLRAEELTGCIVTRSELNEPERHSVMTSGLIEVPVIGDTSDDEKIGAGKINWPHGFQVRFCPMEPAARSKRHSRAEEEVILMRQGALTVEFDEGDIEMGPGDVLTVPIGKPHRFVNSGPGKVQAFIVRGGDRAEPPQLFE